MEITIDCREIKTEEDFREVFAARLHLPGFQGKNLEALYDCLMSAGRKTVINLIGVQSMLRSLGGYGRAALNAMERAERENGQNLIINMM